MYLAVGQSKLDTVSTGTEIARQTGNISFKATEDLGGGLKANFELQTTIGRSAVTSYAHSADLLGDRGAFINLTGDFGAVKVGNDSAAVRALFGAIGDVSRLPVVNGLSAGASTAVTTGIFTSNAGDASARVIYGDAYSKYVAYSTPTISGFTGSVALAPNRTNAATGTSLDSTKSYSLQYANGPLSAAINLTDAAQAAVTDSDIVHAYKMTTILASYDFGIAKVGVTSQAIKLATGVNPGNGISFTANAPVSAAGSVAFGYGKRSASGSLDTRFGDDVKQTFVGYRHDLSKRTSISATWNKLNRNVSTGATTSDNTEQHIIVGHVF